jgi:hypothetical protein
MLSRGAGLVPPFSRTVKASTFQRNLFVDTHKGKFVLVAGTCKATPIFSSGECGTHAILKVLLANRRWTLIHLIENDPFVFGDEYDLEMFLRGVVITSPTILGRSSILVKVGVQKWDGE